MPVSRWSRGAGDHPGHGHHGGQADRDVDQEDVAPAVLLAEGGDDEAAEDRSGGRGDRHDQAEEPERLGALAAAEELLDDPEFCGVSRPALAPWTSRPTTTHTALGARPTRRSRR